MMAKQIGVAADHGGFELKEYLGGMVSEVGYEIADSGESAHVQQLLWASTSAKNPDCTDVRYIEPLIGLDTVNTVSLDTIDVYRVHGNPQLRIEQDVKEANWIMARLPELGISIDRVTQQLEDEGVKKFESHSTG